MFRNKKAGRAYLLGSFLFQFAILVDQRSTFQISYILKKNFQSIGFGSLKNFLPNAMVKYISHWKYLGLGSVDLWENARFQTFWKTQESFALKVIMMVMVMPKTGNCWTFSRFDDDTDVEDDRMHLSEGRGVEIASSQSNFESSQPACFRHLNLAQLNSTRF